MSLTLKLKQGFPPQHYHYSISEQLSPNTAVNCLFGVGCSYAFFYYLGLLSHFRMQNNGVLFQLKQPERGCFLQHNEGRDVK